MIWLVWCNSPTDWRVGIVQIIVDDFTLTDVFHRICLNHYYEGKGARWEDQGWNRSSSWTSLIQLSNFSPDFRSSLCSSFWQIGLFDKNAPGPSQDTLSWPGLALTVRTEPRYWPIRGQMRRGAANSRPCRAWLRLRPEKAEREWSDVTPVTQWRGQRQSSRSVRVFQTRVKYANSITNTTLCDGAGVMMQWVGVNMFLPCLSLWL